MNLPKPHAPTLIVVVVLVFAVIGFYHLTLGRKR